jgi:hypothetical protein
MISTRSSSAARCRGHGLPFKFTEPLEINDVAVAVSFLLMASISFLELSSFILCNKDCECFNSHENELCVGFFGWVLGCWVAQIACLWSRKCFTFVAIANRPPLVKQDQRAESAKRMHQDFAQLQCIEVLCLARFLGWSKKKARPKSAVPISCPKSSPARNSPGMRFFIEIHLSRRIGVEKSPKIARPSARQKNHT